MQVKSEFQYSSEDKLILILFQQAQNIERRRMSLRHDSLRRGSVVQSISKEVPWDIFDRLFLPILYCHALAILTSCLLQFFEIQFAFSTFGIFFVFALSTVMLVLFYHNLKVNINFVKNENFYFVS
jgi:ABC-type transport system involved in cytochrome bd biosynthesis fused ATPase/permease subunit